MNRRISRRLATLVAAASIPLFSLSFTSPAQAATAPAASAADWLSKQLTQGLAHNPNYGGFDDYGLSLDIFFALNALDAKPSSAASIIDALEAHPDYYTGSAPTVYAGAVGKLASAAQLDDRDAEAFGGTNLIATAEDRVVATGPDQGRASDSFDPSDPYGADYSNAIGQAWVVRALATAHSPSAMDVTAYLLKQQCDDGSFRETLSGTQCTSSSGSIDATSFAIQALDVAKANGVSGLNDDIGEAVSWLSSKQASDGSLADRGTPNTNSTGLAAAVLAGHGQTARAQKAAKWVLARQVTSSNAGNGRLKTEVGAIAYDSAALATAKSAGITDAIEDQWRRATAQAAVGINIALPAATPKPPTGGGSGSASSGGSSSSVAGGTRGLYYGDITETQEPEVTDEPTATPSPEPTATDDGDDKTLADPKAEKSEGRPTGWIVAGVAGGLMLATAGAAGIGRLRGGGA